jgi:hypothetical protein
MMKYAKSILLSTALAGILLPVMKASAAEVDRRERHQQHRIAQGVKSGQLTARETAHIEHREARINREIRHDRKENGGSLTPAEKAKVNRQQNRVSRQIYRDKHNRRTQ